MLADLYKKLGHKVGDCWQSKRNGSPTIHRKVINKCDVNYGTTSSPKNHYYIADRLIYHNSKVCIQYVKDNKNNIQNEHHDFPFVGLPIKT